MTKLTKSLTLLDTWDDSRYKAQNHLFKLSTGLKLLISVKKDIQDFDVNILFKGGNYFEDQVGVPAGTAHLMEHMLMNPNKVLKTREEQRAFEFGNRNKPKIYPNAWTGNKMLNFYATSHPKGALRCLELLKYVMDYPVERFAEFLETEKGIVLAELNQKKKEEKDPQLAYLRFIFEDNYKGFNRRVIGTEESIGKITVDDLIKYKDNIVHQKNCIIAVQTNKKPSPKLIDSISEFVDIIPAGKKGVRYKPMIIKNKFKYDHFKDDEAKGVELTISFFDQMEKEPEYKNNVFFHLVVALMNYQSFRVLREQKGLIYASQSLWIQAGWSNYNKGFYMTFEKKNLEDVLEHLYNLLTSECIKFLDTEQGVKWFESEISKYIFTRSISYDPNYSSNISTDALTEEKSYKYMYEEAVKFAKLLTIEEVKKYFQSFYIEKPAHIWFESPYEKKEIIGEFEKSKIYKHYMRLDD